MARRLSVFHYILVGIVCGAFVYLWSHNVRSVESSSVAVSGKFRNQNLKLDALPLNEAVEENEIESNFPDEPTVDDPQPVQVQVENKPDVQDEAALVAVETLNQSENEEPTGAKNDEPISVSQDAEEPQESENINGESIQPPNEDKKTSEDPKNPDEAGTSTDQVFQNQDTTADSGTEDPIEPFDEVDLPKLNDPNRTLLWLDLWGDDPKCTKFSVNLLKEKSLEQRALVSFPGSGNSWLRMLLMGISGVFVDSVYAGEDSLFQSKANSSYSVPANCSCTLLQKTHDFSLDAMLYNLPSDNRTHTLEQFKGQGILLIRNPFKAIRAYRNFDFGGMAGVAPDKSFVGQEWDNFVARSVAGWEILAKTWISGLKRGGIIYYERLQKDTENELVRLVTMLGIRSVDKDRLNCVLGHANDNTFKRPHNTTVPEDPFTASQRLLIRKAIDSVQIALQHRGLDPLPVELYDHYNISPEYGQSER